MFDENKPLSKSFVDIRRDPKEDFAKRKAAISSAPNIKSEESLPIEPEEIDEIDNIPRLPGSIPTEEDDNEFLPKSVVERELVPSKSATNVKERKIKTPRSKSLPRRKHQVTALQAVVDEGPTTLPFTKPREAVFDVLKQLDNTDWEGTLRGLEGVIRLSKWHEDVIEQHMHPLCQSVGRHVKNLRSQVARAACSAATQLFRNNPKKALENVSIFVLNYEIN